MKNLIKVISVSALLSTGLYAGMNVDSPVTMVVPIVLDDPNPFYVGVGISWVGTSRDCFLEGCTDNVRLEDTTYGGIIRAGYEYNQYIGIELRGILATMDSDWSETTHYGIYLKPSYPIGEQLNVYGLLGYGHTEIETICPQLNDSFDHDGFSYGIGFEYDFSDKDSDFDENTFYDRPFDGQANQEKGWGVWMDYQNLMTDEGSMNHTSNVVSFGVTYDF